MGLIFRQLNGLKMRSKERVLSRMRLGVITTDENPSKVRRSFLGFCDSTFGLHTRHRADNTGSRGGFPRKCPNLQIRLIGRGFGRYGARK